MHTRKRNARGIGGLVLGALLALALLAGTAAPARAEAPASAPAEAGATRLRIHSTPPDAAVIVDGAHVGLTPYEGTVAPGAHRVTLALDGHELWSADVFADGKPIHVGAVLVAMAIAVPPPAGAAAAAEESFGARMSDAGEGGAATAELPWPNPSVALALAVTMPLASAGAGLGFLLAGAHGAGVPALTATGAILLISAGAIAPSAGHLYAGMWQPPVAHFFIRAAAAGVGALGGAMFLAGALSDTGLVTAAGAVLLAAGSLGLAGDIVYELVTTYTHAKARRDERAGATALRLGVSPMVVTPWRTAPGVSLALRF